MTNDGKINFILNVAFIVTVYLVLYFIFVYVVHWIMPFLVGFLIALGLRPTTRYVNTIIKNQGKGVAVFVVAMFYASVALLIWLVITLIFSQFNDLVITLPDLYFSRIEPSLYEFGNWLVSNAENLSPEAAENISQFVSNLINYISEAIKNTSVSAVKFITDILSNIPLYLISVIFTIVLSVFISVEYDNITHFIRRQFPDKFNSAFYEARKFLSGTLLKMIKAYTLILSITFFELLIGFFILDVKYALPLAALIAILDILPIVGTGGIVIPWAVIEIMIKNYDLAIGLLILYVVVLIVRNIIEPRIVGREIGLHPIVTITAMYAGLRLFGFIGFILGHVTAILIKYLNDTGKINLFK